MRRFIILLLGTALLSTLLGCGNSDGPQAIREGDYSGQPGPPPGEEVTR